MSRRDRRDQRVQRVVRLSDSLERTVIRSIERELTLPRAVDTMATRQATACEVHRMGDTLSSEAFPMVRP